MRRDPDAAAQPAARAAVGAIGAVGRDGAVDDERSASADLHCAAPGAPNAGIAGAATAAQVGGLGKGTVGRAAHCVAGTHPANAAVTGAAAVLWISGAEAGTGSGAAAVAFSICVDDSSHSHLHVARHRQIKPGGQHAQQHVITHQDIGAVRDGGVCRPLQLGQNAIRAGQQIIHSVAVNDRLSGISYHDRCGYDVRIEQRHRVGVIQHLGFVHHGEKI